MSVAATLLIDARGHRCPVPTLKLQRALAQLATGEAVEVLADDPMARIDIPHFVAVAGHTLLALEVTGEVVRACVRKGGE